MKAKIMKDINLREKPKKPVNLYQWCRVNRPNDFSTNGRRGR